MFNNEPPPNPLSPNQGASNKTTIRNPITEDRLKRLLELKNKSDKISKGLKIKGEKELKKHNLILKSAMHDLDEKQRREVSIELNDKTKLSNILRNTNNTDAHDKKANNNEGDIKATDPDAQKQKEIEELLPYLRPELQFELEEDVALRRQIERRIEEAIDKGNFELATELSDKLANKINEKEINAAKVRKEYAEKLKEEEEKKQKKPKLQWGFETKQRWETKGNM